MNNLRDFLRRPHTAITKRLGVALLIVATTQLFASCGGGGGGISGTGLVFGPITGFGSIIVNNIAFDVADATILLNGAPAAESDLRLGMLVTVRGQRDSGATTGVADSVDFDSVLRGPIEAVDVGTGTVQVLSQLTRTNSSTVFDGIDLATANIGDVVEVSGFVDGDGIVLATRLDAKPGSSIFDIEGTISGIDIIARTFFIGMLQVDYSAADIEDAPSTGLTNGLFVEVEGFSPPEGGLLVAVEVEVSDDSFGGEEGENAELEGFVTEIISPTRFVINGNQNVETSAETEYRDGVPSDLVVNALVDVDGEFDLAGTLLARRVKFEEEED
jgi:hypothetical protein